MTYAAKVVGHRKFGKNEGSIFTEISIQDPRYDSHDIVQTIWIPGNYPFDTWMRVSIEADTSGGK